MLTLTRQGLLLSLSATVIPSQGSSDVPVAVVNDINTYVGYTLEPRVGYYLNGIYKSTVCTYDTSAKTFSVPAEAFKQIGIIDITLALIDNTNANHIETCQAVHVTVNKAPLGTVVLPDQTTWQDYVNSYMNQLFDSNYKPQFDQIQQDLENLVTEAQQQQQTAEQQQTQIDNAISVMGEYQIVSNDPVQIQFKKGDGTYGPTVDLGDGLASKSMVNAGYYQSIGSQYSGSASDYGIEVEEIVGAYSQGSNPSPDNPQEMQAVEISELKSSVRNMFDYQSIVDEATDNGLSANAVVEEKEGRDCLKLLASASITELMFLEGRFKENTQYKFSFTGLYSGSGNGLIIQALYIDGTNKYIYLNTPDAFQKIEMTTDPNKSIKAITFSYGSVAMGWLDLDSSYIVELSQDTGEFPGRFVGDTVTLSEPLILRALPNGVADTYEDGVITRRVGVMEFDGSEDERWGYQPDANVFSTLIGGVGVMNRGCLCDKIQYAPVGKNPQQLAYLCCGFNQYAKYSNFFYIKAVDEFNLSLDDFKTYLQSNPITVWYQLATPTTEQLAIPTLQSFYPFTNAWCDSIVQPQITWNVLTGKSSILDGNGNLIQQGYMTPQDNLLINSDFRSGIINQKGQTQYVHGSGARTYGIDCWYVTGENSSMATNAEFLSINLHNNGDFGCVLDIDKANEKYLTFTIQRNLAEAQSVTFDVSTMNENQDYFFDIDDNTKIGIYFWRSSEAYKAWFYLKRDGVTNIDFMKLERGKYFTGMPVWNKALELQKCLGFYELKYIVGLAIGGTFQQFLQNTQANYYFPMQGFVTKNKTPTITVLSISSNEGPVSNLTATAQGITNNSLSALVTNNQCERPYLIFELAIDANDY